MLRLGIAFFACLAAQAAAADVLERTAAVRAGERVQIEIDFGEGLRPDPGFVTITSHAEPVVRARIDSTGWGAWDVDVELAPRTGGARLDVRARGTTTWMFGGPNIRLDVFVPEDVVVDVVSWGGDVRVEGLRADLRGTIHDAKADIRDVRGALKLRVESAGSAEIDGVRGDVEVDSESGDVRVSRVRGRTEIRTNDGDVSLDDVRGDVTVKSLDGALELSRVAGAVSARTERGRVSVGFSSEPGGIVESARGDVAIELPEATGAELDLRAREGEVDVASGMAWKGERGARFAKGTIGRGGARLVVRSSRGNIRVSQR